LAEILHQIATDRHLGLPSLLKWLGEQCRPDAQRLEEHQLRLESDALAVRIVTIHKSKGLEYPVVFCPFAWESATLRNDRKILFHDPAARGRLTLDLGSDQRPLHTRLAQHELLAENLRLLYVALTRAKKRCYLAWGRINTAETSAPAYLLHCPEAAEAADIVNTLKTQMSKKTDGELLSDLRRLAARSSAAIELDVLPKRPFCAYRPPSAPSQTLTCREFKGTIDRDWKLSSYSAWIARMSTEPELPLIDEPPSAAAMPAAFEPPGPPGSTPGTDYRDIRCFPKGSRAGIFFHDVLEQLDFSLPADTGLIDRKLREYGFDPGWGATVARTVDEIVRLTLTGDGSPMRLCEITTQKRINEMEFYFPLNTTDPQRLRDGFRGCLHGFDAVAADSAMQRLSFSRVRGFFKGYIDLVFEHGGRFYLVDWKSNFLGERLEDYRRENLTGAMLSHFYHLQYHLYTLAANRFLGRRVPDYRYEKDFGGVFYIFIRGVSAESEDRCGVFYDRPAPECIATLERRLIP
jgi:exodeoxyribonuclease V beta subunit